MTWFDRVRWVRIELDVVFGLVALWFGDVAVSLGSLSSWPDQQSPPFVIRSGSAGSWEPRSEPTARRNRARVLVLRYGDGVSAPRDVDLAVRVEPASALTEWSRERADVDGWIRHAIDSPGARPRGAGAGAADLAEARKRSAAAARETLSVLRARRFRVRAAGSRAVRRRDRGSRDSRSDALGMLRAHGLMRAR